MLLIATQNEVLITSFRKELRDYPILQVSDLESLRKALPRLRPAAAFIDPRLGGQNGMRFLRSICQQYRHIPIVAAGWQVDAELPFLRAGARGLLNQNTLVSLYSRMVTAVIGGELWFTRRAVSLFLEELGLVRVHGSRMGDKAARSLSDRELQVARIAITGASNRKIAQSLGITERTVKAHMSQIFAKIGITHRSELFLLEERLLRPTGPLLNASLPKQNRT